MGLIMAKRIDSLKHGAAPCLFCAASALLIVANAGCRRTTIASSQDVNISSPVVVKVRAAETRTISATVTALGRCEALPDKLAMLTPVVEGQVAHLLIKQGERVSAGQAIVQLDQTMAKADLAEKQAARDSLVASLKLLESLPREAEQQAGKLAIEQGDVAIARAKRWSSGCNRSRTRMKCRTRRCSKRSRR